MGQPAKSKFRYSLTLLAASLTVALGLGEVLTRVYLKAHHEDTGTALIAKRERLLGEKAAENPNYLKGQFEQEHTELHPFFGILYRQSTFIFNRNPDGTNYANRWGFLTRHEISLCGDHYCVDNEKDRSKQLVVGIFGGSFAHFAGNYEEYLENALKDAVPGRKPVVINFAMGGHAFPQAVNIYTYFKDVIDVPVFIDGLNELWNTVENNRSGFPPEYAKGAHFRTLTELAAARSLQRLRAELKIEKLKSRINLATELSLLAGVRHSAFAFLAWNAFTSSWAEEIQSEVQSIERSFDRTEPFFKVPDEQILRFAARQWSDYHRTLAAIAKTRKAPSLHLLQPNPYVSGSKVLTKNEDIKVHRAFYDSEWPAKTGYPILRQGVARLKAEGIFAEDLVDLYKDVPGDIWIDGAHPGPKGTLLFLDRVALLVRKALSQR